MKTIMTNIKMWLLLPCLVVVTSACDDFLDEPPKKQKNLEIQTIEQLDGLLVDIGKIFRTDTYMLASDIFGMSWEAKKRRIDGPYKSDVFFGFWDWDQASLVAKESTYPAAYASIFNANTILDYVGSVSGDEALKADVKAAAHYWRAFFHWILLNTYALPYTEGNLQEPGIPYKRSVSFEESIARLPIEECYRLVEEDLLEALKISTQDVEKNWRVSVVGVHAFLARFYFYQNKYDKALEHADKALASTKVRLVDFNDPTWMYFSDVRVSVSVGEPLTVPYTYHDRLDIWPTWPETFIHTQSSCGFNVLFLSDELVNMYDKENDLRYKFCIHPEFGRFHKFPVDVPVAGWIQWRTQTLIGPTIQEVLLTKAECLARQGKVKEAMGTVNLLRAKRVAPGPNRDLTATTGEEAVKKIIEERMRELHLAVRWFDMRRLNHNETAYDDFVAKRMYLPHTKGQFDYNADPVEFTLEPGSPKYALPFNVNDIVLGLGELEQNEY